MAKQGSEQRLMRKQWALALVAVIFFALSYGFISLAIDSGSLWQYAIGIVFLILAIKYLVRGARLAFNR